MFDGFAEELHAAEFFFIELDFEVAFFVFSRFSFVVELRSLEQAVGIGPGLLKEVIGVPVFFLDVYEEFSEQAGQCVGVGVLFFEVVVGGQFVEQLVDDFDAFEFCDELPVFEVEVLGVVAQDAVGEGVEGVDVDAVGGGPDEFEQAFAHGECGRIGEGEAEDVFGIGIGLEEDLADAGGEHVGFSRARSGQHEYGAFDLVHGLSLGVIEPVQHLAKAFELFFSAFHAACKV